MRHFFRMQVHGGQGRIRIGAEELVVTADDGHVPGQGEPHSFQLLHGAQGDQVVEGDDGRGPAGGIQAGEHPEDGSFAAFHIVARVHVVGRIVRQVHQAKLLQEPLAAAGGVLAVHGPAEEGDAPVPQGVQMPDGQPGTIDQVALDADAFQRYVRRADRGDWHVFSELVQGEVQVVPVSGPDASREENPIHPAADQLADQLRGDGLVFHGLEKADAAVVFLRFPVGRVQNPVEIQVGNHREHHGQRAAPAAFEILGGQAGGIVVGVNDLLYPLAGCLPYVRIPADHAGYRGGGDPGFPGDVIDGCFSAHLASLPLYPNTICGETQ